MGGRFESRCQLPSVLLSLQEWIMEKWEEGFYITSVAGSDNNNSLVVMSKGARFNQQSYKVCVRRCLNAADRQLTCG